MDNEASVSPDLQDDIPKFNSWLSILFCCTLFSGVVGLTIGTVVSCLYGIVSFCVSLISQSHSTVSFETIKQGSLDGGLFGIVGGFFISLIYITIIAPCYSGAAIAGAIIGGTIYYFNFMLSAVVNFTHLAIACSIGATISLICVGIWRRYVFSSTYKSADDLDSSKFI